MAVVAGSSGEPVVGVLEKIWASIGTACEGLDAGQWGRATDCPGWTVRDQISHVIGIERMLLGDPPPLPVGDGLPHVRNPFGAANEAWVAARRHLPGDEVLDELRQVTARRLAALRSMPPERFDEPGWSPVGEVPYRVFMEVRAFDCWVHEQDVRKAVGRPGGKGGAGEAVTLDRMAGAMGYVVGRKVAPPDGVAVVWRLTGPAGRQVAVEMAGGRGRAADPVPAEPAVALTMGTDTFWRLACGRVSAAGAWDGGQVAVAGDLSLGRRVLEAMNVTP